MSTYTIPDLIKLWAKGELTAEQAVGHLLQNQLTFSNRQTELSNQQTEFEKRLRQLEQSPTTRK